MFQKFFMKEYKTIPTNPEQTERTINDILNDAKLTIDGLADNVVKSLKKKPKDDETINYAIRQEIADNNLVNRKRQIPAKEAQSIKDESQDIWKSFFRKIKTQVKKKLAGIAKRAEKRILAFQIGESKLKQMNEEKRAGDTYKETGLEGAD